MTRVVKDWETLADFSCVTLLDYSSDDYEVFEFSDRKNDLKRFREKFKEVEYVIGFNNKFFDDIITNYVLRNNELDSLSGKEKAIKIYKLAQAIINREKDYDSFKPYSKYQYESTYQSIDVFLYWSKMLRQSKQLSLKFFAVNLEMNVEEMPIPHTKSNLTNEEKDQVIG